LSRRVLIILVGLALFVFILGLDLTPPTISSVNYTISPEKISLTASIHDASGISRVLAEALSANRTMSFNGSIYKVEIADIKLYEIDSLPVRIFAYDTHGNVAVKQITIVPSIEERFISYSVSRGFEESTARRFYSEYEELVRDLYQRNASVLLPCLELYSRNATAFAKIYKSHKDTQSLITCVMQRLAYYKLLVVDARGISVLDPRLLTLVTIQGLANRERPSLYVIFKDTDALWLSNMRDLGIDTAFVQLEDAIRIFAEKASGYVVYDPSLPDTINVGTTLCGVYNAVLVHPEWISWLEGLGVRKKLFDLRGNFSDRVSAYKWAFEKLWDKVDHKKLAVACPEYRAYPKYTSWPQVACRDYAVSLKLLTVYLNLSNQEEKALMERILAAMPNNSMVMGWNEEGEEAYVDLATRYGKFVAVMMHNFGPKNFANPTVWMHLKPPAQLNFSLPPVRPEVLGKGGVYITFYITDGDNLQFDQEMINLWSLRAGVPVAWTVSPFLIDVAPYMAYYYAKTMSENDTFVCGPSGAGYIYPVSNIHYLDQYLPHTLTYMKLSRLRIVEVLGYSDDAAAKYKRYLGNMLLAIKRDYNEQPGLFKIYGQSFYYIEADGHYMPVLFGALHFRNLHEFEKKLDEALKMYEKGPQPRFNPAEDLLGFSRKVDDPSSPTGMARYAAPGERLEGAHTFGPYVTLPAGRYTARFLLKIDRMTSEKVATLDVCTDIGRRIIASREISGSDFKEAGKYQWFELSFVLDRTTSNIEFRIWYRPESNVGLYCGLIDVPSNLGGGLPFLLVISQPWDISDWKGVAKLLHERSNITPINLHEFISLVNVEYGYGIAKSIMDERITAGKLSKDKAAELQALLDEALSLYKQGNCYEAVRKMIAFYRELSHS